MRKLLLPTLPALLVMGACCAAAVLCPVARGAAEAAGDVQRMLDGQSSADLSVFPIGEPNRIAAEHFTGESFIGALSTEQVGIFNVTFEPGCINEWHTHHAASGGGQILIVTAGRGWYQEWGKAARELRPGDVVNVPAGVRHWHGAAKDSWFQHIAVAVPGEGTSTEWHGAVSSEDYAKLN